MYNELVKQLRNESDCDEYEDYVAAMLGKAADAIEELSKKRTGVWIPITTRPMTEDERKEWSVKLGYDIEYDDAKLYCNLPDDGQRVLVYYKYSGEVGIDTFRDDDGCYFEDNGDMDGIAHWMPLPEKPKEEEK